MPSAGCLTTTHLCLYDTHTAAILALADWQFEARPMPRVNPLLASLTDFEYDMVGCLAAGFTIADALRILGRDRDEETMLRADPRFHAVLAASAAHLAMVAGSLCQSHRADALATKRQQSGVRKPPIAAVQTNAGPTMSFQELLRLPAKRWGSDA
jgi:hypothetical protein